MVAFQKRWPVIRGKINMICKEWCMEIAHFFSTLVILSWPFQRGSTVFVYFYFLRFSKIHITKC